MIRFWQFKIRVSWGGGGKQKKKQNKTKQTKNKYRTDCKTVDLVSINHCTIRKSYYSNLTCTEQIPVPGQIIIDYNYGDYLVRKRYPGNVRKRNLRIVQKVRKCNVP